MDELHIRVLGEDGRIRGHFTGVLASSFKVHTSKSELVLIRLLPLKLGKSPCHFLLLRSLNYSELTSMTPPGIVKFLYGGFRPFMYSNIL